MDLPPIGTTLNIACNTGIIDAEVLAYSKHGTVLDGDVYDQADKVILKLTRLPVAKRFVTSKTTLRVQHFMNLLGATEDIEDENHENGSLSIIR